MPKMKTKKIVSKRFRITKNGKILHRTQGARHIRRKKSKSRQRRQDKMKQVTNTRYKNTIRHFMAT